MCHCGPYPIPLVLTGPEPQGLKFPYDGTFIYTSINAPVEYILVDTNMVVQERILKNYGCDIICTLGGGVAPISLVEKYRKPPSRPPAPGVRKMALHMLVPNRVHLTDEMRYSVAVTDSPQDSPTIAALFVELVSQRGRILIKDRPCINLWLFNEQNLDFSGEAESLTYRDYTDLTNALLRWELRCWDETIKKLKVLRKNTTLAPSFSGEIGSSHLSLNGPLDVSVTVRNELDQDVDNCVIVVKRKDRLDGERQMIGVFHARSARVFKLRVLMTFREEA